MFHEQVSRTVRCQNQMFDYRALYESQPSVSVDFLRVVQLSPNTLLICCVGMASPYPSVVNISKRHLPQSYEDDGYQTSYIAAIGSGNQKYWLMSQSLIEFCLQWQLIEIKYTFTADILTKLLQKCFLSSPLPTYHFCSNISN